MQSRELNLKELAETVQNLIHLFQQPQAAECPVYEEWTAKDVLGHLTFWHESFARNVAALGQGIAPQPLKGRLLDLNPRGVAEMRTLPLDEVLLRLTNAQNLISQYILDPQLGSIPYTAHGRAYTPEEHLGIVQKHILKHTLDIQKSLKRAERLRNF